MWICYFIQHSRLVCIATSVVSWYFHHEDGQGASAYRGLIWAFTTSSGSIAFGSVISTIVEQMIKAADSKLAWCNPVGLSLKILFCCIRACVEALTKFAQICHVFTAKSFCASAKDGFDLLKRRFMGALIVDQAGIKMQCFSFSHLLCEFRILVLLQNVCF